MSNQTRKRVRANFRINARRFFLTYAQCSTQPSVVLERIKDFFKERLDYAIVGQEHHKDGNLHLHVLIVLKDKYNCRNERVFDGFAGKHGKYEAAKSESGCIKYVCKEGFNIISHGIDWKEALRLVQRKQSTKSAKVAHMVMEDAPLEQINEEFPGYMLLHHQQIESYQQFVQNLRAQKKTLIPWNGCNTLRSRRQLENGWEKNIIGWLNSNMGVKNRRHKTKQLWVYGETGVGKSLLIHTLLQHFHGYEVPEDNGWIEDYNDDFDFIYVDEYNDSFMTGSFLNRLAEGVEMKLKRRGRTPYIKKKNLPLIICSNQSISEVYASQPSRVLDAMRARFLEVEIPEGEKLMVLTKFDTSDEDTCEMYFSEEEFESDFDLDMVELNEGFEGTSNTNN